MHGVGHDVDPEVVALVASTIRGPAAEQVRLLHITGPRVRSIPKILLLDNNLADSEGTSTCIGSKDAEGQGRWPH
jgi:hypothetical protein